MNDKMNWLRTRKLARTSKCLNLLSCKCHWLLVLRFILMTHAQAGCVCAQVRSEIVAWICQWVWQVSSWLSLIGANCIPSVLVSTQRECGCYYGGALEPLAISTFFCNQNTHPTKVWVSCWRSSLKVRLSDLYEWRWFAGSGWVSIN